MNAERSICQRIYGLGILLAVVGGLAGSPLASAAQEQGPAVLRVGTSGDYAPFSMAYGNNVGTSWKPQGFDIAVAETYARDRNLKIEWVQFQWPHLRRDLARNRFDIAMSGVTQRPERSLIGHYTVPVAATGAVALVRDGRRFSKTEDLNHTGVTIGVNRGGHLERVTRGRFPNATIRAVTGNETVPMLLIDGEVDAVVSDTLEAPHWQLGRSGISRLGPFSRDEKSYLVQLDRADLARDLNAWLIAAEADGTLNQLRKTHLGRPSRPQPAAPTMALLSNVAERLSLMPLVAASKKASGRAIEDPEREKTVLQAATRAVRKDAEREGARSPSRAALENFFRIQMDAAKAIQRAAPEETPREASPARPLDLDSDLRPALDRIGSRMAFLLTRLPAKLDPAQVQREATEVLAFSGLDSSQIDAIAESIVAVAHSEDEAEAKAVPSRVLSQ